MINNPNYKLPKNVTVRLFDNPIPAGSPDRQAEGVPEWARTMDHLIVNLTMRDGELEVLVDDGHAQTVRNITLPIPT